MLIAMSGSGYGSPHIVRPKVGAEIKFSLGTDDVALARLRGAEAKAEIENAFLSLESEPRTLSQRSLVALSGFIYRLYVDTHGENPGTPKDWTVFKALSRAASEGRVVNVPELRPGDRDLTDQVSSILGDDLSAGVNALPPGDPSATLEVRFGALADWVLVREGFNLDAATRLRLLKLIATAAIDAGWQLKRNAEGDYSPDARAQRFPALESVQRISVADLFERWRIEARPASSTVSTWRGNVEQFIAFVGAATSDIRRVSTDDVIHWKDHLVGTGLSGVTISAGKLAAIKALFNFAIANKLIERNPAEGVKVSVRRQAGTSRLPYTDKEVFDILRLASNEKSPPRRWLPWLCATSGARVGEVAQLFGNRITIVDCIPVMRLSPADDGGSLKNEGSERTVPLHPSLIEQGFLEFVEARGPGPLFYKNTSGDATKRHASKGVANHLADWIRENGFEDPRKAPNHSFRHWFKSAAVRAGISDSIANAIQGHATPGEASRYRHFDMETLAEAVAKIRITV